jgi:hypothetical protein
MPGAKKTLIENNVKAALGRILENGWTVCKGPKEHKILPLTLLRKSYWFHNFVKRSAI